ncbi:MAG TPA: phosphoribosylformylglycinamidine cyclo-ligase [Longimicrobiales bacterium]|nr:phosphoribosylformylglycinamidine cyclo-ligase [Longimicrobiales bacterium]
MSEDRLTYGAAGVDLDGAARAKERLAALLAGTRDALTLSDLGSFGGLYAVPPGLSAPVLVASADGVGTKLKVAFAAGRHDTVGRCLVNHCVNDILVQGARPLFFLDYLASGGMDEEVVVQVVSGVAAGCRENGCALLGGETAQMPGFYAAGEYDLAGFVVGVVERERILDGSAVAEGDVLVGLASTGLHTNGYSLARRIVFDEMGLGPEDQLPGTRRTVADELLTVHRSYLAALERPLTEGRVHALAHITGGGIPGNLPRVLPEGLGATVRRSAWEVPPVFRTLQEAGRVAPDEMDRVFNMGIGMIAVADAADAPAVQAAARAAGVPSWIIGEVGRGEGVMYA